MAHMAGNSTGRHRSGKRRVTAFPAALILFICFFVADSLQALQALAAPNLVLPGGDTSITSDSDYNVISGAGNLTIRDAHVHANNIDGSSIRFFGADAVLATAGKVNIGSFYIENSTLRANGIFQSTSTGAMVMNNSHIVAELVSLGYDYINNNNVPPDEFPVPPPGDPLPASTATAPSPRAAMSSFTGASPR